MSRNLQVLSNPIFALKEMPPMKLIFIICTIIIILLISNISAEYWSSSVTTNSSSWYIYRQSQTLNFNLTGSVSGQISPVEHNGRNCGSYSSYYANLKENDVEFRERTNAQEGSYKAEEELALRSYFANDTIGISIQKPAGSDIFTIFYQESWPVYLMANKGIEYSGQQINDREFEGNNRDFVENNLLYNNQLKKVQRARMWLENMNATLLATENSIISASFEPNKVLNYELAINTTGLADLRYRQSQPLYDFKRQTYFPAVESRETYYGNYNISRKMHMELKSHINNTSGDEWLPCCYGGWLSDQNGIWLDGSSNYSCMLTGTESNVKLWLDKGLVLLKSGNYSEALAAYEKVIELFPSNASAWNQKGAALALMGRQNESMKSLDRAIELDPHYATPWYNKGKILSKLGRNDEAINAYDKAIDIDPQNSLFWYAKGNVLLALNHTAEAGAAFDKARAIVEASAAAGKNQIRQ